MEDDEHHKYLASYIIDAWRARGGRDLIPAKINRESFCDSPEVVFDVGGEEKRFFFGKTPFNDEAASETVSDKWKLYRTLRDEIPLPYTEYVSKKDERRDADIRDAVLKKIADPQHDFSFPLIVKPSGGSLSRNVFIARDVEQLDRAIASNRADPDNGPGILFQQYLGDSQGLFREIRGICLDGKTMIAYDRVTHMDIPDDVVTDPAHWPGVVRREVNEPDIIAQIDAIAEHLYENYGVSYVAFDMKCDREGRMWVLEGNVAPLGLDEIERQMPNGGALIRAMTGKMLDKVLSEGPDSRLQISGVASTPPEPQFF